MSASPDSPGLPRSCSSTAPVPAGACGAAPAAAGGLPLPRTGPSRARTQQPPALEVAERHRRAGRRAHPKPHPVPACPPGRPIAGRRGGAHPAGPPPRSAGSGGDRRPTRPAWTAWLAPSRTSRTPRLAAARVAGWASRDPSARAAAGTPAASPPDRFGWRLTATTSLSQGSASSRPTSPPASSLAAWSRALPASWRPPSAVPPTAGSSPSPSKSSGPSRPATARRAWSGWT
jgi:hypothetical protein